MPDDSEGPDLPPIGLHKRALDLDRAPVRCSGEVGRQRKGRSMTTTTLHAAARGCGPLGLFLAAGVRAEPPGGEGEGGEKVPFVRTAAPGAKHNWSFECTATSGGLNTKLDCDDPFPNNEPNIVVDRGEPAAHDRELERLRLVLRPVLHVVRRRNTWSTGNMSTENDNRTGSDPVTTHRRQAPGRAPLLAELPLQQGRRDLRRRRRRVALDRRRPDLGQPVIVGPGRGCDLDKFQNFSDKEWITTDNNPPSPFYGRSYVTWTSFYRRPRRVRRVADPGEPQRRRRQHWTKPQEISGSNAALCTFQTEGPAGECDEDQASVPTVAPTARSTSRS